MKKLVLSFIFLFYALAAFTQNNFTIRDFQVSDNGESTTYVLKPDRDVNEFTFDLDVTITSDKGSFSLAWNFCDSGDCNLFHCFPNAFVDIIGSSPMVILKTKDVKLKLVVNIVSDQVYHYQLFFNNQLKSEGNKVIVRDFSRKLYLNLTITGNSFKINPPSLEYAS